MTKDAPILGSTARSGRYLFCKSSRGFFGSGCSLTSSLLIGGTGPPGQHSQHDCPGFVVALHLLSRMHVMPHFDTTAIHDTD
jgi:hypothetical protein